MRKVLIGLIFASALCAQNRSTPLVILPSADDTKTGCLRLREKRANGINYTEVCAPNALAGNPAWILPSADGTSGQALKTNGTGTLSFGSVGTGDVSGPASATGNNVVLMDGTTGKLIKDGGKGLPTGAIVGTTDTQTLSAKTLTTPIVGAYTVGTLPAAGTANRVAIVTDAATAGSCTSGGGSARALCRDTGSAWESLGDGGSGSGLTDFDQSIVTNTVSFLAGRARMGNYTPPSIGVSSFTGVSGTGALVVYVDASNNLVCNPVTGVSVTTTGAMTCSTVASPSFPANSIPLYTYAITAGVPSLTTDHRAYLSNRGVSAGTGISISEASGTASVAIDTATVPQLGGSNTFTGANDFTGASSTAPAKKGTSLPATCAIGDQYFKSDATAGSNLYGCTAVNTWTVQAGGGVTPSVRDTYANLPTCNGTITGQIFKMTAEISGYKEAQCNGTSWQWYMSNIPITLPGVVSGWTNLGSSFSTAPTDVNGGIYFSVVNQTTAQGIAKAVPGSTPYTITVGFTSVMLETTNAYALCSLAVTDGTGWSTTKSLRFGWDMARGSGGDTLSVWYWSAPGTPVSGSKTATSAGLRTPFQMLRYRDNGTNRYFETFNGLGWETFYSESRTTNFTATHFAVICGVSNADANGSMALALHHYKVD